MTLTETPAAVAGWRASTGKALRTFERVSIYNGTDGGREYELAPTGQKEEGRLTIQTWNLKTFRDMNLFLRCRYKDTSAVLSVDIPQSLTECRFTFELASGGRIVGKPSMLCK
jgi:hypothetical protein